MTRVLVAEDSPSTALLLQEILRHAHFDVVGIARDGNEAVAMTAQLCPDVVTMDVQMPGLDGIEATRLIMERTPTPIVVVSAALDDPELQVHFRALNYGAAAVVRKPPAPGHADFQAAARHLTETVQAVAGVPMVRRRQQPAEPAEPPAASSSDAAPVGAAPARATAAPKLLAIGASTGGPQALASLLTRLPCSFGLPVLIVQHISPGFIAGLADWLDHRCPLCCSVARDGEPLRPGHVLFAPDGRHLEVAAAGTGLVARLSDAPPVARHQPSATPLFDSVALACGPRAIGLVMTGMGSDGCAGLLRMRERGALTLAQSPDSCVVPNMPQAAIDAGAAAETIPLDQLPARLGAALAPHQEH
ncbi:two-component system chemotaxis response regulator CheB [Paraburkholderia caballeronis]|uniref:chemotaxis-specific protein-glutamate methyltransferase CheB n=1 Tax=Paraburkholderia caballeronis TaxID=416943 RepID=UPI0010651497|nr:chemotaxis-specific protein-glutamate methyltransferase CheB [Paraburkholderia caballeronis]TDV39139.1 two-component system chemotaxis response regulator CheB [Paraburkholderia caballeronis]